MFVRRARFRIERRVQWHELRTQATQHFFQHVIAADADPVPDDLHVCVAVAEMPGKPNGIKCTAGRNLHQAFILAAHENDRSVIQHETVAVMQRNGLLEIDEEFRALLSPEHDASSLAIAGIEHDAVEGQRGVPLAGMTN